MALKPEARRQNAIRHANSVNAWKNNPEGCRRENRMAVENAKKKNRSGKK